jgi:endoglucanase
MNTLETKRRCSQRRRFLASLAAFTSVSMLGLGSLTQRPRAALRDSSVLSADSAVPKLRRGVALSSWFANAPRQPLVERDFVQIRAFGFDHVRLQVNPELLGLGSPESSRRVSPDPAGVDWTAVDDALRMAIRCGLAVILEIHPEEPYKARLESQSWVENDLIALWSYLARRHRELPPGALAYELLNEPPFYNRTGRYQRLVQRLVSAVRVHDQRHLILVSGPLSGGIEGLHKLTPLDDSGVAYTFHYYSPFIVTHQGMSFGFEGTAIPFFRSVPYPSNLVDQRQSYVSGAPNERQAQTELRQYRSGDWNAERISKEIGTAAEWAASNRVRLICTEFGAYRAFIDPASRYHWIRDVRHALEKHGIGWTVYDYADVFGITVPVGETRFESGDGSIVLTDPARGQRLIEPEAIVALELRQP